MPFFFFLALKGEGGCVWRLRNPPRQCEPLETNWTRKMADLYTTPPHPHTHPVQFRNVPLLATAGMPFCFCMSSQRAVRWSVIAWWWSNISRMRMAKCDYKKKVLDKQPVAKGLIYFPYYFLNNPFFFSVFISLSLPHIKKNEDAGSSTSLVSKNTYSS